MADWELTAITETCEMCTPRYEKISADFVATRQLRKLSRAPPSRRFYLSVFRLPAY